MSERRIHLSFLWFKNYVFFHHLLLFLIEKNQFFALIYFSDPGTKSFWLPPLKDQTQKRKTYHECGTKAGMTNDGFRLIMSNIKHVIAY